MGLIGGESNGVLIAIPSLYHRLKHFTTPKNESDDSA